MVKGKFYMVGVFSLIGLVLICLTILTVFGSDIGRFLLVAGPIASTLLSLIVISSQVSGVQQDAREVKEATERIEYQTNGALTKKLNELKEHVTEVVSDDS